MKSQRKFSLRYKDLPRGDFPSLPGLVPVFSERAVRVLQPLIKSSVEILPIIGEADERFYLVNVIDVLDCLDQEKSKVRRLTSGGIIQIFHYEFKDTDLLEGKGLVKFVGLPVDIFVTDAFKRLVEEHDLKGLLWKPLP